MPVLHGDQTPDPELREVLDALRERLLVLHKALIDSERIEYESSFGTISTPNQFLKLLINDPWFAWLSPAARTRAKTDGLKTDRLRHEKTGGFLRRLCG